MPKTIAQELLDEIEKNKALEKELKSAKAEASKARVDAITASVKTTTTGGAITPEQAAAEYGKLKGASEKREYRKKNWKILGCNEER